MLSEQEDCGQVSEPAGPNQVIMEDHYLRISQPDGPSKVGTSGALLNYTFAVSVQGNSVIIPRCNVVIAQIDLLTTPKAISLIAKFKRSLFEALIKEEFTVEQAQEIVVSIRYPERH